MDQALVFEQFNTIDAFRRMQGDILASLGFGPLERGHRTIISASYWRLRDYGHTDKSRSALIVAAPIKRPYIWDLAPSVSAIQRCLDAGLHVYLLEWLPASRGACNVGIAECVQAISLAMEKIGVGVNGERPILMGHSFGGTLAAIYSASAPAAVGGLIMLSAPLCFREGDSLFRDALVSLVPSHVSDATPYPGSILSQTSAIASPATFVWSRYLDAISCATDSVGGDIYARVERWALDEVALPGKLVSEIVEWLYREDQFFRGVMEVGGRMIGPKLLSAPTLAVVNTSDPIAPLSSMRPIGETLGPEKFDMLTYPGERGVCLQHLGVLVGRQAHARIWPQVVDWIETPSARASQLSRSNRSLST